MQSSDNSTDSSDASIGQHDGPNFETERMLPSVVSLWLIIIIIIIIIILLLLLLLLISWCMHIHVL